MTPEVLLAAALRALDERASLLVVTGAGVSAASGIATFRGSDRGAIWKQDVTTLGTHAFFRRDPVGSWSWYLTRFARVTDAEPNAAHVALVDLERRHVARGGAFLLVTQNVDVLHERAGTRALVKVHGSADRVRCDRGGCVFGAPAGSLPRDSAQLERFVADPCEATLPRCPACRTALRQHVLWFDECYDSHADYEFERVLDAAHAASLVLFVGTSFSVGVTDAVLQAARRSRTPAFSIDPGGHPPPRGVTPLAAAAEALLPVALADISGW